MAKLLKPFVSLAVCSILTLAACNSAPPAADTQAAEAQIRKTDADWVKAAATRQPDAWVAFYSDDAVVLPPNDKVANTRDAIHKSIADMMALPNLSITWEPTKVEVAKSGELAYLYGKYQLSFTDPKGNTVNDHGKMVEIWKKQADGSWKCIVDTWNSDVPLPAAS